MFPLISAISRDLARGAGRRRPLRGKAAAGMRAIVSRAGFGGPGVGAAARRVTGSRVGGLCRVVPGYAGFKTLVLPGLAWVEVDCPINASAAVDCSSDDTVTSEVSGSVVSDGPAPKRGPRSIGQLTTVFGKADGRLDPWGCNQANPDWTDWADWCSYHGEFIKKGLVNRQYY